VRGGSTKRGYDHRWQRASDAWLESHPLAIDWFGVHGERVIEAEVVDHIIPWKGDQRLKWDSNNWQGLTKRDHDRKTALENSGPGHWENKGTADKMMMRWVRLG
jgi:5-methylcytosine-specific restriction protein A